MRIFIIPTKAKKMKKLILCLLIVISEVAAFAQSPYTSADYTVKEEKDIFFGKVTGYAGNTDSLFMDLYKPMGDDNCKRPCLVMVHGGAFIEGNRSEVSLVSICREMAKKGYVVASIDYRLGNHKRNFYTPYALCDNFSNRCIYVADSSEVIRALYRGMQDTKGAIRFLKERASQDSTDTENFFVGGESAGGFIATTVGFMDLASEKPADCAAISDAPTPDNDLISCIDNTYSLTRPDLGPVEGTLNIGTWDASVKGIANFYGGLHNLDLIHYGVDTPAVYLFHQSSDLIVDCGSKSAFKSAYQYCYNPTNLCQPLDKYPVFHGSCAIEEELVAMGSSAPPFFFDYLDNGPADGSACLKNPPGHATIGHVTRCQNMADLFAPIITASGNAPANNCFVTGLEDNSWEAKIFAQDNQIVISSTESLEYVHVDVSDMTGKVVLSKTMNLTRHQEQQISFYGSGVFVARMSSSKGQITKRLFFLP